MIFIIDNKDSFVYNLATYVALNHQVKVVDNTISVEKIRFMHPDGIIISPGPGSPDKRQYVGNVLEIIKDTTCPILGVCLGHQAIAHVFGGKVERITPVHGKASEIFHDGKTIFAGIPPSFYGGRYHSLAVSEIPIGFSVSARTSDGTIMGIRSDTLPIEGVQFHPESILTEYESGIGKKIIENFISLCEARS